MVLVAFLIGLAVAVVAGAVAVLRAIALWRQTRRTASSFATELGSFEEKAARTERHLAEWERSSAEFDAALERLRASRARLLVLQNALGTAQARVRWLRVFVP